MSDETHLLERARQGDSEALESLALAYGPRVLRFGRKMCRDEQDAREIAQQTMLSVVDKLADFRGDSGFSTWLFAIARSHCIKLKTRGDGARSEPLEHHEGALVTAPAAAPDEQLGRRELEIALDQAIGRLEPGQREVLLLRDVEGLPASEVAAVLSLSVEAVKSRLHRARKELRSSLSTWFDTEAPGPTCPDVVDLLSRYREGDITSEVCRTMEAHVDGCPACATRCQALRTVLSTCSASPAPQLPEELKRAVSEQIRRSLKRQTS